MTVRVALGAPAGRRPCRCGIGVGVGCGVRGRHHNTLRGRAFWIGALGCTFLLLFRADLRM